ncbi:MAG: ABC transporter permease subunit [Methylotenera sp.]|jgi:putrescine transport system permease protein|nr:MAG: putrescine ABC transporter permease PotH [Methylotenera sp.]HNU66761.1 ABC transporter permease subunit [Methylotenera sp.]HOY86956.1 ABC transporter permease subunit [Methylotenera sp.]HPH07472.1 ABC transporter permease subunit [Methylotenera sp.]HPM49767.1 ABC transporter permease subunit [Methylotenera sp.]
MATKQGFFTRLLDGKHAVIGIPYLWFILLAAVPILIILKISLSEMQGTSVSNMIDWSNGWPKLTLNFSSYQFIFSDSLYLKTYLSSIKYALLTTLICLVIGYPFAYFMARSPKHMQPTLLMLIMLPFWTSFLLRIYAWKTLLENNGIINNVLMSLGVIDAPLQMMNTPFSLMIGMVYSYLPFMILPLYANLSKLDMRYLEAAADLGTSPFKAFWLITVPLSKAGIIAGSMLVFIPTIGEYVIPELLGGSSTLMIGRVLWNEFFSNNDWPMASAVAVVMILLILVPMAIYNKSQAEAEMK